MTTQVPDPKGFLAAAMDAVKNLTKKSEPDALDVARGKVAAGETLTEKEFDLINQSVEVPSTNMAQAPAVLEDAVNHPRHYTSHPSGVECITITEHMSFNIGNAVKYLWRVGHKVDDLEDLKKARWYIDREIAKRETQHG